MATQIKPAANIVLAIGGLNGFVSTEVQNSTFVLRINDSAKNPAHRQYVNRYHQFLEKVNLINNQWTPNLIILKF